MSGRNGPWLRGHLLPGFFGRTHQYMPSVIPPCGTTYLSYAQPRPWPAAYSRGYSDVTATAARAKFSPTTKGI